MINSKIYIFLVATILVTAGSIALFVPTTASACLFGACGTAGGTIILPANSTVTATYQGGSSADNSLLKLALPTSVTIGTVHVTPVGTTVNLGQFPAGTELVFSLSDGPYTWQTGSASRNSDGSVHACINGNGTNQWTINFEDQPTYWGNSDYNDAVILVTATPTPVCTPNTTKTCVGNAVYNFDSCGTQGSLYQTCSANQACSNGACVNTCTPNTTKQCVGNAVYNFDSCGTQGSLYQTCSANQTCSNGACINTCTPNTTKQCVGNSVYWFDSCNTQGSLFQTCSANQTCSNGSCVDQNINCSTSSDCGTSGYTGSPFCQNGNVYQNYKTYTCANPGTTSSVCSSSTTAQLKTTCSGSQACSNGTCGNITCSASSDCGANAYTGSPFCQGNNVYQNYITYTCNNGGTTGSYCSTNTVAQQKTACTGTQTCGNGSCTAQNITCSSNTDCGTSAYTGSPFCQGSNVYQNYTTYTCNNSGSANSYCSTNTVAQQKTACTGNQTCSNGTCNNQVNTCTSHAYQQCNGNNLTWFDSCGVAQDSQYCQNGCYNNYCQGNNNGTITIQTLPATNITTSQAALNGYVYGNTYSNYNGNTYVWFQWGPTASYGQETLHQTMNSTGGFSQLIYLYSLYSGSNSVFHYRGVGQTANGALVYGPDMTMYTNGSGYGNGNLNVNTTVRDLTNGSGFASSASALPGDMLMFMITLQANGSDVQNVVVRDNLPANLIYNNQLVVACTTNSGNYYNNCSGTTYNNYTGNISSGVYLNTIYSGQTVTITYQVQVAPAYNFAYGSTTLSDNVFATSSNGNNPTSSAPVYVTRAAVYGASLVSTGLTNNFWTDSFFLPLLITLILIWMWQAGMFITLEKWLGAKMKNGKKLKTERELQARIAEIKNA